MIYADGFTQATESTVSPGRYLELTTGAFALISASAPTALYWVLVTLAPKTLWLLTSKDRCREP